MYIGSKIVRIINNALSKHHNFTQFTKHTHIIRKWTSRAMKIKQQTFKTQHFKT